MGNTLDRGIIDQYLEERRRIQKHTLEQLDSVLDSRRKLVDKKADEYKHCLLKYKESFLQALPESLRKLPLKEFMTKYQGNTMKFLREEVGTAGQLNEKRGNLMQATEMLSFRPPGENDVYFPKNSTLHETPNQKWDESKSPKGTSTKSGALCMSILKTNISASGKPPWLP
eukprot:TRINITY_DN703_c0_g1_i3.p1 TRINITY_DN703_c0_g1~~TRINITY_DN703_c0_g1_i3.p1  ORF type:complete len:171 (-),score=30.30 TRINITY_DN703_c0_g1_i3:141-653(-)